MKWLLTLMAVAVAHPLPAKESDWASYDGHAARHLAAMTEPSFATPDAMEGYEQRVRLLVLPTFEPGYSIRVDLRPSGKSRIVVVSESGQGGYSPGRRKPISAQDGDDDTPGFVRGSIRASGIDAESADARQISAGAESDDAIVCTDGTAFYLEYFDAQHRHRFIKRTGCDLLYGKQRGLVRVAAMLHGLGKIPLEWHLWSCIAAGDACGDWDSYNRLMD